MRHCSRRHRFRPPSAAALAAGLTLAGAAAAQVPEWRITPEMRVGSPDVEFGGITDVALDGAGRLWIVDGMVGELHVATPRGVRRVATQGRGPGELSAGALELVVLPGDTVLVIDPQSRRLDRFAPDGSYVRSASLSGEDGMTGGWRSLPGGGLAARVYPGTVVRPGAQQPPSQGDPVRAFDGTGVAGDVLAMLPPTESFRMGAGPLPVLTLLAPQPLWDVDAGGRIFVASTHRYEVTAHDGDARRTLVTRPMDVRGVRGDVAEAARVLLRETLSQRRTPAAVADRMVAAAEVAEEAPVIGGVMAGPDGTVWVQDAAHTGEQLLDLQRPGGPSWHIFDAQGRTAGTATLDVGVQPVEWRGSRLAAIARDSLGRTAAVVLRVDPPGA